MKRIGINLIVIAFVGLLVSACSAEIISADSTTGQVPEQTEMVTQNITEPTPEPTPEPTTEPEPVTEDALEIDYEAIQPDESGEIMIVMYHNLSEKNTEYARTIESFKADLLRLYEMGFTAVSMTDFSNGYFDVPAGRTPVVLTFDDGHITNFKYIEKGDEIVIDPDSVVAILDAFAKAYPEFGKAATFYLNAGNPFGQPKYVVEKLAYLSENGYEIGNHAYDHEDLTALDGEGIQRALGKNVIHFRTLWQALEMNTLSLPYGKAPASEALKEYVYSGTYEEVPYENEIVLKVGWKPTRPIYYKGMDVKAVHRVQSGDGDMQLTWWLDQYEANPSKRFISDGFPDRISVPKSKEEMIDETAIEAFELILYGE